MNYSIFYLIPCIVCLVWTFIFLLRKKTDTQKICLQMLCIATIYFFLYMVIFSPDIDNRFVCMADIVVLPWVLGLLASLVMFVNSHMKEKITSNARMQWLYMPACVEGGIVYVLYYLIGLNKVTAFYTAREMTDDDYIGGTVFNNLPKKFDTDLFHIFYLFDFTIFNILTAVMSLIVIIVCIIAIRKDDYRMGDFMRFLFHGAESNKLRVIANLTAILLITMMPLSLLGRTFIVQHTWIGCTISVLASVWTFLILHCEIINNKESFTLYELFHVDDTPYYINETASQNSEKEENAEETPALTFLRYIEKNNNIIEHVHKAFDDEKIWLNPDFKLGTLAEKLNTNRNKLSVIINQIYGKDFKTLVAELRIEESKRIMKEDSSATMDYVAQHSGYKESSIFFHRFKDMEGVTPTEWKLKN